MRVISEKIAAINIGEKRMLDKSPRHLSGNSSSSEFNINKNVSYVGKSGGVGECSRNANLHISVKSANHQCGCCESLDDSIQ